MEQLLNRILVILMLTIATVVPEYRVGVGISDVTGPIVEIGFIGYANPSQKGRGLHLRQYARAFIIAEGSERIAFVVIDAAMTGYGLRTQVLSDLNQKYDKLYNEQNFIISATHTHSTPGGFMMDLLYDIPTLGFVEQTFAALRNGIVKAVINAHKSIQSAKIFINSGVVLDVNINRSPTAYLLNPKAERDQYAYDVDKTLIQMKFISKSTNTLLGILHWFPVHPTSMNNTNKLVSSDNVGYASVLFEQYINKNATIGNGPFVAAFASSNLGDVSPNIKGPHCANTGLPCDDVTSTCNGRSQQCYASGPGQDMFESTKIIAERLFKKGLELSENDQGREVEGPLHFGHQYVHMPSQFVNYTLSNGTTIKVRGCLPALGYSFAAGTTDGPGHFDFKQGTTTTNPFWNFVSNLVAESTDEDKACHYPKPIFLATGRIKTPYRWQPSIVSIQAVILGNVIIAAVPGEFTTMSGRRLKNSIKEIFVKNGGSQENEVIIAGLANSYSSYIVTPEEYQVQRYEGAATIFGPHTLPIYLNLYSKLLESLLKGEVIDEGTRPTDISGKLLSFTLPVIYDLPVLGYSFGNCLQQPPSIAKRGTTVRAKFVSGNSRNNLMHEKTFLAIERWNEENWIVVATDANWETKFIWNSLLLVAGYSESIVEWYIGDNVPTGIYRMRHFGYYKPIFGAPKPYQGSTNEFKVI